MIYKLNRSLLVLKSNPTDSGIPRANSCAPSELNPPTPHLSNYHNKPNLRSSLGKPQKKKNANRSLLQKAFDT